MGVDLFQRVRRQAERAKRYRRQAELAVLEDAQLRYEWVASWLTANTHCEWSFYQSFPLGRVLMTDGTFFIVCRTDGVEFTFDLIHAGYPTVLIDRLQRLGVEYVPNTEKTYLHWVEGYGTMTAADAARLIGMNVRTFLTRSHLGWSVKTIRKFPNKLSSQWEKTKSPA